MKLHMFRNIPAKITYKLKKIYILYFFNQFETVYVLCLSSMVFCRIKEWRNINNIVWKLQYDYKTR